MLEQVLAPTQFCTNAKPNPESNAVVEFAVRLPGAGGDESEVLLPIDAKFPMEDYNRLLDASVQGDAEGTRDASRSLLRAVETSAKDIRDKYINPPLTTDFAIMYLPTEGLYAEVVRSPEMLERMQRQFRVVVAVERGVECPVGSKGGIRKVRRNSGQGQKPDQHRLEVP